MSHPVDEILRAQKRGEARGIPSICSAHPWVLKTALRGEHPVLIESTCNQVNQSGGYTGMTPADFVAFVRWLSAENQFPTEQIIFGGDHLGPSPWQDEPADRAIHRAVQMVRAYVQAGFTKIHLDASMRLADDDPSHPLDLELAARRTAFLACAAEDAFSPSPSRRKASGGVGGGLCYVIGTEVPLPGGATKHEECVRVTTVEDAQRTLEFTHAAFVEAGLESAWERVVALVVQPGVEFGDDFILDYSADAARDLARFSETMPLVYEAHSTDYQLRASLRNLVRDHFAILKVGPALTFAFREAVFALAMMEQELIAEEQQSHLIETLESAMLRDPRHWQKHYHGTEQEQAFARKFSLSDRVRYYWPDAAVQAALGKLLVNLGKRNIPLPLISQYLPSVFAEIRKGCFPNHPYSIIHLAIQTVLENYHYACNPDG
jgi:D-tagatose-1,6-bisphosphate aldolase subunit GatZ/KbaZ